MSGLARQPPAPPDPNGALEEAARVARAASHSRRLDTATQAALNALVAFAEATVGALRAQRRRIDEQARAIAALEAQVGLSPTTRPHDA
ncbi:hypothetical protein DFR50_107121 [Roseiarcus fermentans]|uniref:Uncharacterized protein n=1 Tax=Roseiarcus fermentans TaxID=1473586 RepID=A0A366FMQ3_9HYPH|nr:hypothetical protein [Roseiarcus fermentans]RBP15851.1 hypothetical protein DFR50_107121 [Roseiarcus fermentans]